MTEDIEEEAWQTVSDFIDRLPFERKAANGLKIWVLIMSGNTPKQIAERLGHTVGWVYDLRGWLRRAGLLDEKNRALITKDFEKAGDTELILNGLILEGKARRVPSSSFGDRSNSCRS